jgi:hypothetical protein
MAIALAVAFKGAKLKLAAVVFRRRTSADEY